VDAARSVNDGDEHQLAAAVAAVVALERAVPTTPRTASQVLGGIGYTWEHDAHLYLRPRP